MLTWRPSGSRHIGSARASPSGQLPAAGSPPVPPPPSREASDFLFNLFRSIPELSLVELSSDSERCGSGPNTGLYPKPEPVGNHISATIDHAIQHFGQPARQTKTRRENREAVRGMMVQKGSAEPLQIHEGSHLAHGADHELLFSEVGVRTCDSPSSIS